MNYYTSDLHLGHENIIAPMNRPYNNATEMDEDLVKRWNKKVKKNDDVYIIGDLSYKSVHQIEYYLDRLAGHKHLIIGNHDEYWMKDVKDIQSYFDSVSHMELIQEGERVLTLCHFPMFEWGGSRYIKDWKKSKTWMIHGHIHNSRECDAYKIIREKLFCELNAGIDINNLEPVTFNELLENNCKWYGRSESYFVLGEPNNAENI